MPRKVKDYSKGKIYIIRNTQNDKVYVGSTTQRLCERMSKHRSDAKGRLSHLPLYVAFNEIGVEHFYIELLEDYPCKSIEQLLRKEGEWIRQHNSFENGYNGCIAGRIHKESVKAWNERNKDKIIQDTKKYYEQNKDKILQQCKEYYSNNKEKYIKLNKEWYEKNKDKHSQKSKERYERNKEKLSQKVKCECGCETTHGNLTAHRKTKKHQEWLQSQPSSST